MRKGTKLTTAQKQKKLKEIIADYGENPDLSLIKVCKKFGVKSDATFYNWINKNEFEELKGIFDDLKTARQEAKREIITEKAKLALSQNLELRIVKVKEIREYMYKGEMVKSTTTKEVVIRENAQLIKYHLNNDQNSGYTNDPTTPPADPGQTKDEIRKQIFDEKVAEALKRLQDNPPPEHDNNDNIKT